jgi:DNA-binding transcriptional LysR family regulator
MKEFNGGDLYLGCAESEGISLIAQKAKALQEQYPNIHFHLYSGNSETVCERLDKGLLDFAVVVQNIDLSKYSAIELPVKDRWGLLCEKIPLSYPKKAFYLKTCLLCP